MRYVKAHTPVALRDYIRKQQYDNGQYKLITEELDSEKVYFELLLNPRLDAFNFIV